MKSITEYLKESTGKYTITIFDGDGGIFEDNIPNMEKAINIWNKNKGLSLITLSDGEKNYINFDVKNNDLIIQDGQWDGVEIK